MIEKKDDLLVVARGGDFAGTLRKPFQKHEVWLLLTKHQSVKHRQTQHHALFHLNREVSKNVTIRK